MDKLLITADLCDAQHRFFYYQGDYQPCPYCKIQRMSTAYSNLVSAARRCIADEGLSWRGLQKALDPALGGCTDV